MAQAEEGARPPSPSGRAERLFSGVGLATSGLLLVALLLATDVALTRRLAPEGEGPGGFHMNLTTRDGRRIGGTADGVPLVLTPGSLYANRPGSPTPDASIEAHGLRGAGPAPGSQRRRVLVVGGSAAYGLGVADDETLSAQLQVARPDWEVLNAGVLGYLAWQELGGVVFDWIELEPAVIVAFDGWNDAYEHYRWAASGRSDRPHARLNWNYHLMEDRLAEAWRVRNEPGFALAELAGSVARNSTLFSWLLGRATPRELEPVPDDGAWLGLAVDAYVASLRKLRDFGLVHGAQLLVVVQPERAQRLSPADRATLTTWQRDFMLGDRYHESFPESYARFRARAVAALEREGIPVLDPSQVLPGGSRAMELFLDPVHPSPEGHAVLARFIAPRLDKLLGRARPQ